MFSVDETSTKFKTIFARTADRAPKGAAWRSRLQDITSAFAHDKRRGEILAAVRAICSGEGISRLSISAVTERAGCTLAVLPLLPHRGRRARSGAGREHRPVPRTARGLERRARARRHRGALDSVSAMLKDMVLGDDDHAALARTRAGTPRSTPRS
ncbi:MAG: hypothetical protein ACLTSX_12705 [Collinsella sp.]